MSEKSKHVSEKTQKDKLQGKNTFTGVRRRIIHYACALRITGYNMNK